MYASAEPQLMNGRGNSQRPRWVEAEVDAGHDSVRHVVNGMAEAVLGLRLHPFR